jgi:hypothetical protein
VFQQKIAPDSSLNDFYAAIEHAPMPIQRPDSYPVQPFFIEEEDGNFSVEIKAKIEYLETKLALLEKSMARYESDHEGRHEP